MIGGLGDMAKPRGRKAVALTYMKYDYATGSPEERKRIVAINRVLGDASRVLGDGEEISNPLAILKAGNHTIGRLVAAEKIGRTELQAIEEIERVYQRLCSGLWLRGYEIKERGDRGQIVEPLWFLDAYHKRYKPWADEWSRRKTTHGDHTLSVVYDILFSSRSGKEIDAEHGWKHGLAVTLFINGVRDYSAQAGWADRNQAKAWREAARSVFPLRRVRDRSA